MTETEVQSFIEFFIPGADSPLRLYMANESVFAWENVLFSKDADTEGFVSVRIEEDGLYRFPKNISFRTRYGKLSDGIEPFERWQLNREYSLISEQWNAGLVEINRRSTFAYKPLPINEYHSWANYFKADLS